MPQRSTYSLIMSVIVGIGIVLLAAAGFGLQKIVSLTAEKHQEYLDKLKEQKTLTASIAQKHTREEELKQIDEQLKKLDLNLIGYEYIPTFLEEIEKTTLATGNRIQSIHPDQVRPLDLNTSRLATPLTTGNGNSASPALPPEPANASRKKPPATGYQLQQINMEIHGNFVSVLKLLNAFRQFPKMLYIRALTLSPQANTNNLSVRMETYAIITPPNQFNLKGKDTSSSAESLPAATLPTRRVRTRPAPGPATSMVAPSSPAQQSAASATAPPAGSAPVPAVQPPVTATALPLEHQPTGNVRPLPGIRPPAHPARTNPRLKSNHENK